MRGMSSSALILLLAVATIAVVSSCGGSHRYPQELSAVDSICKDSAEVAMSRLEALSEKYDQPSADAYDRNYYLLLKVKAANNAYQPPADSTIFHVLDFFRGTAEKDKLCQSYYYLGKYYIKKNDAPQGLENFQKALDLTDENTPLYFRSCIYNQTGRLFLYQGMFDDALQKYEESYKCDSISGDTVSLIFSMRDIATIYDFKKEYQKCLALLHKAYDMSARTNDNGLHNSISQSLAICYFDINDIAKSKHYLMETLRSVDPNVKSSAYSLAIDLYTRENKMDSVFYFSQELLKIGTVYTKQKATSTLCAYYFDKGEMDKSQKNLEKSIILTDSVNNINAVNTVAQMNATYNFNQKEKENIQLRYQIKEKVFVSALMGLVFIMSVLVVIFKIERHKKRFLQMKMLNSHLTYMLDEANDRNELNMQNKQQEIDLCHSEIRKLNEKNENDRNNYEVIIKQMQEGLRKQEAASNGCGENNDVPSALDIISILNNRIKEKKNVTNKDWERIIEIFDNLYPAFRKAILEKYNLKMDDYKICILVKLDFPNVDIAEIMNKTPSAITMKRANLYAKIEKTNGKAKDFNSLIKSI